MESFLSGQAATQFFSRWTWGQWFSGAFLVFLGCLNLIWPVPLLILLAALLILSCFLLRPYSALILTTLLIGFECIMLDYTTAEYHLAGGIFYFVGTLGLLCWCMARLAGVIPAYQSTAIDLPLATLYISAALALFWSAYIRDGLFVFSIMTMSFSIYLLISALNNTPRQLERLFWLWFILGIITIISTIATFFFGITERYQITDSLFFSMVVSQYNGTRPSLTGFMVAPKAIAGVLNISLFCGWTLLATRVRRGSQILIYLGILGMVFIHLLTMSRLEAFGMFFGWLTFASLIPQWHNGRIRRHLWMAASVAAMLLALIVVLGAFNNLDELLARAVSREQSVPGYRFSAAQARYDFMGFALTRIWETGGLGAGVAGIMRGWDESIFMHSPSLYFSFLTDHGYGLLSIILMFWLIVNLVMDLRWALRYCPDPRFKIFVIGVCSGLVAYGVAGIGDHFFYIHEMYVLLGFGAAAVKGVRYLVESESAKITTRTY